MPTLKEQIDAAKLADSQPSALKAKIEAARRAENSGFENYVQDATKSMFPQFLRENTPVGAISNTLSGVPQAAIDTINLAPTIAEWISPGMKSGSLGRIPDMPVPDPESTKFGRTAAEWMTPLPGTKFNKVADTVIGGSAATGELLGGEKGELGSGFLATLATLLRGKPPTAESSAVDFLTGNLADNTQEQAINNIKNAVDQGEIGTISELAGDRGLMAAENAMSKPGTQLSRDVDDITKARQAQMVGEAQDITGFSPSARPQQEARSSAKLREAQLEGTIEQQVEKVSGSGNQGLNKAKQAQYQAKQPLVTTKKPAQASADLSKSYSDADSAFRRDTEKPAWAAFDNGKKIETKAVLSNLKEDLDVLSNMAATDVTQKYGDVIAKIRSLPKNAEPRDVHYIVSEIGGITEDLRRSGGGGPVARSLNTIRDSLENSIRTLGDPGAYDNAKAMTKQRYDQFKPRKVGAARKTDDYPEEFAGKLFNQNESGAAAATDILASKDPNIITKTEEYVKSVASKKGIDEKFMENYDEFLDRFPQLKSKLLKAKSAQDAVAVAEGRAKEFGVKAEKQKSALKNTLAKRKVNQFIKNPKTTLDDVMKNDDLTELTSLQKDLSKVDGGTENLNKAVKSRIYDQITKNSGGVDTIPAGAINEFHKVKRNLIDSGILTQDEVIDIEKVLAKSKLSGLRRSAGSAKLNEVEEVFTDIGSSAAAIAALEFLPAQNQLMMASTVKRIIKKKMGGSVYDKDTLVALESMIKDPEKFLNGIAQQKITSNEKLANYIDKFIRNTSKSVKDDEE